MIPRPEQAIVDLAGRIGNRIVPELPDPYAAVDAGLISMLLTMLAAEAGSGVDRRMQDAEELKALFATAEAAPGFCSRARFLSSSPASMALIQVNDWLGEGLRLLIDLHAWAEDHDEALNQAIWDWLARHTDRHRFDI